MNIDNRIINICQKEIDAGCYDAKIEGVSMYSYIRDDVRRELLIRDGFSIMPDRIGSYSKKIGFSLVKSSWHIFKLFYSRKRYTNVFYPFARVEKVGGVYIDKFTDPIIDECNLNNYLIFDRGKAGEHVKPRLHSKRCVYVDMLQAMASIKVILFYNLYIKKYKKEFSKLYDSLSILTGGISVQPLFKKIVLIHIYSNNFKFLLKRIKPQRVIGPSRPQQLPIFIAAKKMGIETIELQHGVTYGESVAYSGFRDPMVLPDIFLAFGDNNPPNVYGISEERIINTGFALFDYIDKQSVVTKYNSTDVLVVSEPEITETMISVILQLSRDNPHVNFYFRLHPHEFLTNDQEKKIKTRSNVFLQDRSINIIEVLHGFNLVIGESSTVLYEALSMRKKVGRLHYDGLNPLYLSNNDKDAFWQISNQEDFLKFLNGNLPDNVRSIYSPFDKKRIMEIFTNNNIIDYD